MTRPAPRNQKAKIQSAQKQLLWVLFSLCFIVIIVDGLLLNKQFIIARGAVAGALLSYLGQSIFAWFAYRKTHASAGRTFINNMYKGQVVKWMVVILGFALIFTKLAPISSGAVMAGFIIMQLANVLIYYHIEK